MINRRDIIRIKMPFPDISSNLAVRSHMYICRIADGYELHFAKCQTLKPYMLGTFVMKHYWDEYPDIERNPFTRATRIDCDKEFYTRHIAYSDSLKTTLHPDVCEDGISHVDEELEDDGWNEISINEEELLSINASARLIQ